MRVGSCERVAVCCQVELLRSNLAQDFFRMQSPQQWGLASTESAVSAAHKVPLRCVASELRGYQMLQIDWIKSPHVRDFDDDE